MRTVNCYNDQFLLLLRKKANNSIKFSTKFSPLVKCNKIEPDLVKGQVMQVKKFFEMCVLGMANKMRIQNGFSAI